MPNNPKKAIQNCQIFESMKKQASYFMALIAVISGLTYFTLSVEESDEAFEALIIRHRAKKENFLRTNSGSPFVQEGKEAGAFSYFSIDKKYRVTAKVEKIQERQISLMQNSDGSFQRYLQYAWLHFEIDEKSLKLLVLKPTGGAGVFLGFADDTSGDTSYGGGRYLDIGEIKGDQIILDFNLANNPYCAYSEKFQCPLPPKENILTVKIEAGEADYEK